MKFFNLSKAMVVALLLSDSNAVSIQKQSHQLSALTSGERPTTEKIVALASGAVQDIDLK